LAYGLAFDVAVHLTLDPNKNELTTFFCLLRLFKFLLSMSEKKTGIEIPINEKESNTLAIYFEYITYLYSL